MHILELTRSFYDRRGRHRKKWNRVQRIGTTMWNAISKTSEHCENDTSLGKSICQLWSQNNEKWISIKVKPSFIQSIRYCCVSSLLCAVVVVIVGKVVIPAWHVDVYVVFPIVAICDSRCQEDEHDNCRTHRGLPESLTRTSSPLVAIVVVNLSELPSLS